MSTTVEEYRYSFLDINLIIAGVSITGFTDGDDCLVLTPRSARYNTTVGADANVAYTYIADFSYDIQIKLLQTAESNTFLAGLAAKDRVNFFTPLPLLITNAGGTLDKHTAAHVVISGMPTSAYGKNQNAKIWTLTAGNLITFPAGNTPLTS